jgi:hypothetical protein
MNLLLDTNVVLDVLLIRPDWLADAEMSGSTARRSSTPLRGIDR